VTPKPNWLIEDDEPLNAATISEIRRNQDSNDYATRGSSRTLPPLALTLHDVVIHNVHKWFGGAHLRLDALVVRGKSGSADRATVYQANTFRFPDVRSGQRLDIDTGGLLLFYGGAYQFLSIFILVARDRKDSDDLAKLLIKEAASPEVSRALAQIGGLGTGDIAAAMPAVLAAASALGGLAYQVVRGLSPTTVGIYRGSWLQHRDGFGVGRHPENEAEFHDRDFSFWYEISLEER